MKIPNYRLSIYVTMGSIFFSLKKYYAAHSRRDLGNTSPLNPIDELRILTDINTEYGEGKDLYNVSCDNDSDLWT